MRNTPLQIRIIEYANANPMVSYRQISRAIGCHHSAVNDVMLSLEKDSLNRYQDVIAPKVVSTNFFEGNAMITADHHNPCADLSMVQKVIDHAKEHKIKRLFDMGDFFNFDALSNYARKIGGDDQLPRLTDELDFGYGVLKMYSTWFDEIYLMLGNHEGRYAKALSNALNYSDIVRAFELPKVKVIEANFIRIDGIRFTHPRSYSQMKLSVARRLTNKFMEPTFMAHGHFGTWGYADNGLPCGDIPCMCDSERIQYLQGGDTTHPYWNKGFMILKDKQIYPRSKGYGL